MSAIFNRQNAIDLLLQQREKDIACGGFYSLIPDLETLNNMTDHNIELLFIEYIEEYIEKSSIESDTFYYGSSSDVSIDSSASNYSD